MYLQYNFKTDMLIKNTYIRDRLFITWGAWGYVSDVFDAISPENIDPLLMLVILPSPYKICS